MNVLDALAVVLVVLGLLAGFRSGALPQLGGLCGAVAGGALAVLGLPHLLDLFTGLEPLPRAIVALGGILFAVAIGEGLGSALGQMAGRGLGQGLLGALDRVSGAVIGLAQGILVVWLAGGLLIAGPIPRLARMASTSVAVRTLSTILPPPTELAADLGRVLDATGLPQVFVGLEPLPTEPVPLPGDPEARAIARLAEPSTVKVSSLACGYTLSGSAAVVATGYVVTNAHVVAGTRASQVILGGTAYDATTVLFDPELDVAVLRVPRLGAPALRFATAEPDRGATGAAIGFPGGGPLRVIPAAVSRQLEATGLDLYDANRVTRDVIELHARIQPGDSGGPFVLPDGTIGGLVFAQSKTDANVGYALSPVSVATRISRAIGRSGAVDTGSCIR